MTNFYITASYYKETDLSLKESKGQNFYSGAKNLRNASFDSICDVGGACSKNGFGGPQD